MDNDLSGNCEDHSSSDSQSRSGNVQGTVGSGPANTSGARESIGEAGSNATPVTAVGSSRSGGNRVLDERRSRLTPEILDCLICLKDWEDARLGIQRCRPREEFREYFADSDVDGD